MREVLGKGTRDGYSGPIVGAPLDQKAERVIKALLACKALETV